MNKYIPAGKLIAEIEKRQEYLGDHNFHSMASEYDWLLGIVESLQQEQPKVDLDKEIEMYISSKGLLDYAFLVPSIARHFAEWGAIHLKAMKQ